MAAGFTQPADTVLEWSERLQSVPSFRSEFAEFVSELGDRGAYYLLSLLANIAVAAAGPYAKRSFPDENDGFILSQTVLMELFHVGYVEASTRESLFRVVQKLLPVSYAFLKIGEHIHHASSRFRACQSILLTLVNLLKRRGFWGKL